MIDVLLSQWQQQTWLELVAVVFSLLYVYFAAKQNILCWPSAIASTALYTWLFWQVTLPFQAGLNFYYFVMAIYGWTHWKKVAQESDVSVISWSLRKNLLLMLGICVSAYVIFEITKLGQPAVLFLDVFVAVASAAITFLVAQKVLENWLYWIVINSLAIYLYLEQGLLLTALLFVFYIAFSLYGYFSWRKAFVKSETVSVSH